MPLPVCCLFFDAAMKTMLSVGRSNIDFVAGDWANLPAKTRGY